MKMPDAVLFDCDGTLVDSETVTARAMTAALAEQGHTLTEEHLSALTGHPWPRNRAYLAAQFDLTDDDIDTYNEAMGRIAVPMLEDPELVFEDVVEVLDELGACEVPLAVVTSSSREHLARVLSLGPLRDRFSVRVAREDTEEHKPTPVPYQEAMRRLRRSTDTQLRHVTVVEDSVVGVSAGVAARCWTVAVQRNGQDHDLSAADVVTTRLEVEHLSP